MTDYAPCLRSLVGGERVSCVASMVTFDPSTVCHLMTTVVGRELFAFSGPLPAGKLTYSLLNVRVTRPMPRALLVADEESFLLHHDACTWESVREVIEVCSGFGGLGQGLLTTGFRPSVCNDMNALMLDLYDAQMPIPKVHGDLNKLATVASIWDKCPRSTTLSAGIACQPYSRLGDGRGGQDPRSSSLSATLACAHFLRSVVIILECVEPAQSDPYVIDTIRKFCNKTGFHYSDAVLRLQNVWPCVRTRWWCILSAPALGPIRIRPWPTMHDCSLIKHVLPYIIRWPFNHEKELELLPHERAAFQVDDEDACPYFMQRSGVLPCPLHAWGSQLRGCPCLCRSGPLSSERLKQKGLFGVIVWSAFDGSGLSRPRHIHPCECAILAGQDPTVDFGERPLLTLSAIGQIASPLQAAWVGSHVIGLFEELQRGIRQFEPLDHLHALRTLLVAKSQAMWPFPDFLRTYDHAEDVHRWEPWVLSTYDDILASEEWDFMMAERCLAGVMCQLREAPGLPHEYPQPFGAYRVDHDGRMDTVSVASDEPEPETFSPSVEAPRFHVVHVPHGYAAVLYPPDFAVALVRLQEHQTVQQLLEAESQLHGFDWTAVNVYKADGSKWALNEVIMPGQFAQLCIAPRDPSECLFQSPSVLGFPGPVGQLPLHAEMLSEDTESQDGVQYRVPQGPNPVTSVALPHPVAGFVQSPGLGASMPLVGPSTSCASEQSVGSGECGPLPFRLPTILHANEPLSAEPAVVPEPGLPAQCAESGDAIAEDGKSGMPMPANGECGPLPYQMPTDVHAPGLSSAPGECGPLPFKLPHGKHSQCNDAFLMPGGGPR